MVRPHAKRLFCPDPSVTPQVLHLRMTRFEDEVGIAVECSLIEPQLAHRPDGISTGKRPSQLGCRTKRPSHFRDIKVDRFRIARPDSLRDLLERCLWPRTGSCPTTRRPAARTGHW